MADHDPNEQAFLKVSREHRLMTNDLHGLEQILKAVQRMDGYIRMALQDIEDRPYGEQVSHLVAAAKTMSSATDLRLRISELKDDIEELEGLQDVYLRGRDIVAAKLTLTRIKNGE